MSTRTALKALGFYIVVFLVGVAIASVFMSAPHAQSNRFAAVMNRQSALTNTKTQVGAGPVILDVIDCQNDNASAAYLQIFNKLSANVTVGTTAPDWAIRIPNNGHIGPAIVSLNAGTGITIAATTTATGSTAPATALDCNFGLR